MKCFLIIYSETDEIHFILLKSDKLQEFSSLYNAHIDFITRESGEKLIEFIHSNKVKSFFSQTYTEESWFSNEHKIEKVFHIPELGY